MTKMRTLCAGIVLLRTQTSESRLCPQSSLQGVFARLLHCCDTIRYDTISVRIVNSAVVLEKSPRLRRFSSSFKWYRRRPPTSSHPPKWGPKCISQDQLRDACCYLSNMIKVIDKTSFILHTSDVAFYRITLVLVVRGEIVLVYRTGETPVSLDFADVRTLHISANRIWTPDRAYSTL